MEADVIHNDKFQIEQMMRGEHRVLLLKGIIDEDTNLDQLLSLNGPLIFSFQAVTSINSCGVRTWVNFMKQVANRPVYYDGCPPLIVRQMNMVPSFVGHAKVLSVFASYICDSCEKEKMLHIPNKSFGKNIQESFPCEACGNGEMEFDGQPQQYFAFAK